MRAGGWCGCTKNGPLPAPCTPAPQRCRPRTATCCDVQGEPTCMRPEHAARGARGDQPGGGSLVSFPPQSLALPPFLETFWLSLGTSH